MNRNVLKTALSMTRHFAFNVAENQSLRTVTGFGEGHVNLLRLMTHSVKMVDEAYAGVTAKFNDFNRDGIFSNHRFEAASAE